ncbi:helix-turn-helix domain-containing protein [Tabrizicola sp. M-4]|uniref:helix-turn-helix domain-containing protein n=1 Tax=Tabrizicola sp. M-4 TaxID=3055847 RepID=UPI003DA8CE29
MQINQIRAARALIGISQADLAAAAGVSVPTVKRAEGQGAIAASPAAVAAMRAALEARGIVFLAPGDVAGGLGVALRS